MLAYKYRYSFIKLALLSILIFSLETAHSNTMPGRIITLSDAISETVWALGHGKNIVATDATSQYPEEIKRLPKVSKNRSISAEVLLSYRPDLVIAPEKEVSATMRYQFKNAGVKLITINQEYSPAGAIAFIKSIAKAIGDPNGGELLAAKTKLRLNQILNKVKAAKVPVKKVLFIYARGAGTMTVAGEGSQMAEIITLAGGMNAIREFREFKPYSTERLVASNPDVILMFDFGLSSLGGIKTLLQMPGVNATKAGKNQAIIQVDGPLMVNFSYRLPEAIKLLHEKLAAL